MDTETPFERTDLLPASIPAAVLVLLALGGAALWIAARRFSRRHAAAIPAWAGFLGRAIAGAIAFWTISQAAARGIDFAARGPLWLYAALASLAVESIDAAYAREAKAVSPRLGRILPLLRCASALLVLLMLLQPHITRTVTRPVTRHVAVLLDDSDSMHFEDTLWTPGEKIGLGVRAGICDAAERPLPSLARLPEWRAGLQRQLRGCIPTNQLPREVARTLRSGASLFRDLNTQVDSFLAAPREGVAPDTLEPLLAFQRTVRDAVRPACDELLRTSRARTLEPRHLEQLDNALASLDTLVEAARTTSDTLYWDDLPQERRDALDSLAHTNRAAIAQSILSEAPAHKGLLKADSLLDKLSSRYDVTLYRMGAFLGKMDAPVPAEAETNAVESAGADAADSPPLPAGSVVVDALRAGTDFTACLEHVQREIPSDQLAGVLMVTDGRHNGTASPEPVARLLRLQESPISTVLVGGSQIPCDLSLSEVYVPESVYLGDHVRARAKIRATRANGRRIAVRLKLGEETVDESELHVNDDDWRREVRLSHTPTNLRHSAESTAEAGGPAGAEAASGAFGTGEEAVSYRLEVSFLTNDAAQAQSPAPEPEDEFFEDNNVWPFDVAVSDDRTAVLLVDDRPRWEFRYLRNLFYGRDKSIHLQYWLATPDQLAGAEIEEPLPPASASRPFGEAEAGSLPESPDEWRKFDVIIVGDLPPSVITPEVVEILRECVVDRGALLVVVAGPRAMPHAYGADGGLAALLPIAWEPSGEGAWTPPEEAYRVALTPTGHLHPVLQQSASVIESEAIWDGLPDMRWRFQGSDVQPGAELLAYAEPVDAENVFADITVENAAQRLDEEARRRRRDALVVARNMGRGKVLMLNFDQTWRMRYLAGDRLHHRFWGQVVRWGTGEKLRAGRDGLRVGTDRLAYAPGDVVQVFGRVTDERFQPVNNARPLATLLAPDGERLHEVALTLREDAQGFYEGVFPALATSGVYRVELRREDEPKAAPVRTLLLSAVARRPAERAEPSASRDVPELLARLTGGRVVPPEEALSLWDSFGEGRRDIEEKVTEPLWNHPLWFILLIALLGTEWLLRKRGGLA
ncbi:MAG: hypothetical protein ACOX5G_08065 [Kiritimatiellia bacterium]